MNTRRWGFHSLFWRLAATFFVISFVFMFTTVYAARFEGPFGFLRDTIVVSFFNNLFDNSTNGGLLFTFVVCLIGVCTGALVSYNVTSRLRRIAQAADAWSGGDFSVLVRDRSPDELGQLARDLNSMAEQVQTLLATRQQLAVAEERNRLARELHDSVKQHVFANALLVRAARMQMGRDPETARKHLEEAEALAGETQEELIALIRALRPAAIADKGLAAVVREYVADWSQRTEVAVDLRIQDERATPLDVEDALFRVAQEALANVERHSAAHAVELRLAWEHDDVCLSVRDDGHGFDVENAAGRGLGLASMRERVEALGGTLAISSSQDGTVVEARAPAPAFSAPRSAGDSQLNGSASLVPSTREASQEGTTHE